MQVAEKGVKKLVRNWGLLLVGGLAFAGAGVYSFAVEAEDVVASGEFLGFIALASGIAATAFAVTNRNQLESWGWYLALAILDIAIGALFLTYPVFEIGNLSYFTGFWLMIKSASLIGIAIDQRNHFVENWAWGMVGGILTLTTASFLIGRPFAYAMSSITWAGISFISLGLFSMFCAFKFKDARALVEKTGKETIERKITDEPRKPGEGRAAA